MAEPKIRPAELRDIDELVRMRWDFTFEDVDQATATVRSAFSESCRAFLAEAIASGRWQIWVAEVEEQLVSHAFVALVDKVPRPVHERTRIAYLTNVYTRPSCRSQGVGAAVIRRAQEAAREADVELMIVWPSDESVEFYEREGFERPDEPLIWRSTADP
jgi:GNAT superfamily N-acetyltransferase